MANWFKRNTRPSPGGSDTGVTLDYVLRRSAKMPDDLFRLSRLIIARCRTLLSRQNSTVSDDGTFVAKRIAEDYLPTTVEAFLQFPSAKTIIPVSPGGQTPYQIAKEQLKLLKSRVDQIESAVLAGDRDALLAHSQFLQIKFPESNPSSLTLP